MIFASPPVASPGRSLLRVSEPTSSLGSGIQIPSPTAATWVKKGENEKSAACHAARAWTYRHRKIMRSRRHRDVCSTLSCANVRVHGSHILLQLVPKLPLFDQLAADSLPSSSVVWCLSLDHAKLEENRLQFFIERTMRTAVRSGAAHRTWVECLHAPHGNQIVDYRITLQIHTVQ